MKARLLVLGLIGVAALACHPIFYWDMTVAWTLDGGTNAGACSAYNIGEWQVRAEGDFLLPVTRTFPCGAWDSDQKFFGIEEGHYTVTIKALEKGTGKVLASRANTVPVFQDHPDPDHVEVAFKAGDFSGGLAAIDIYWNINGTEDGTATGKSWDTCAEVGAAKAVVTVDGTAKEFDCSGSGNMSGSVKVAEGDHQVTVKLVDIKGNDLTTEAKDTIKAKVSDPGEFTADFYYYSFKSPLKSTTGTYHYATSFGTAQTSCMATTPQVSHTTVYLEEPNGGAPVNAQFCGTDSSCFKTNGSDLGKCWAQTSAVKIASLTWGLYSMTIQGGLSGSSGFEACWKKKTYSDLPGKTDILVGAGVNNPTRQLNLPKVGTSALCL